MITAVQAMIEAARTGDIANVGRLLADDPSLVNARNERGESAILVAAYRGYNQVIELLLASGAEPDVYEACALGDLGRVRALVPAPGPLVDSFSPDGFTPLALASFFGHREIVQWLLARGADIAAASKNQMRVMPLHAAVAGRHLEIARLLLTRGAPVNACQQAGYTPLHGAAQNGQAEMVRLLLEHGADTAAQAEDGRRPLDVALGQGHTAVAGLLAQRAAASGG